MILALFLQAFKALTLLNIKITINKKISEKGKNDFHAKYIN